MPTCRWLRFVLELLVKDPTVHIGILSSAATAALQGHMLTWVNMEWFSDVSDMPAPVIGDMELVELIIALPRREGIRLRNQETPVDKQRSNVDRESSADSASVG